MNHENVNLHDFAVTPSQDWTQSYITSAATLLLLTILYTIFTPWLSNSAPLFAELGQLASLPLRMWRNVSNGPAAIGVGSPLQKVFGLDSSRLLRTPTISSPTRSIASLIRKRTADAPAGLGNWDNSCYQNSVIQGLASLPSLPPFLRDVEARRSRKEDESTSGALLDIFAELYSKQNAGHHLWLPRALKSMSTWQQQDAQEYFSKILDQVDRETSSAAKASASSQNALGFALDPGDSEEKQGNGNISQQLPALRNPLEGLLAQRVACTRCGHTDGLSITPFNCLTVQLGNAYAYDIRHCLNEYTNLEFIPDVQCPKCTLLHQQLRLKNLQSRSTALPGSIQVQILQRLKAVEDALEKEDFSDSTIVKTCGIKKENWILSTKTKQAVVARPPRSLVIHVNRSCFNEFTGVQTKNYADVDFPLYLDLGKWCVGGEIVGESKEGGGPEKKDSTDQDEEMGEDEEKKHGIEAELQSPAGLMAKSMLPSPSERSTEVYGLRAVVTHHGRHENGHYICYRRHLISSPSAPSTYLEANEGEDIMSLDGLNNDLEKEEEKAEPGEGWWQLSDESVRPVTQDIVLGQGEVFMLFYEKVESDPAPSVVQISDAVGESGQIKDSTGEVLAMRMDVDDATARQGTMVTEARVGSAEGARPDPENVSTPDTPEPVQAVGDTIDGRDSGPKMSSATTIPSSETAAEAVISAQHSSPAPVASLPTPSPLADISEALSIVDLLYQQPNGGVTQSQSQSAISDFHNAAVKNSVTTEKENTDDNEVDNDEVRPLPAAPSPPKANQQQPLVMRTSSIPNRRESSHLEGIRVVEAS